MREKDDRANSNRFRWMPYVAREAAVAGGVERLHAPLVNSESAWDKWIVSHAVNDTSFPQHNAVTCASRKGSRVTRLYIRMTVCGPSRLRLLGRFGETEYLLR